MERKVAKVKDIILAARTKKGLTQAELEGTSGVWRGQISRLEQGKTMDPPFFMILKLSRALKLSMDAFVDVEIESRFNKTARKKASMRIRKRWRENGAEFAAAIGVAMKKKYKKTRRLTGIALVAHENNLASKS
jgi:transcriptional regulator with XRE-family HTH domain